MKKLILLLLFIPLVFSCSSDSNVEEQFPTITIVNGTIEDNKKSEKSV